MKSKDVGVYDVLKNKCEGTSGVSRFDALSLGARNGLFGFTDSSVASGMAVCCLPSPPTAAPSCPPHLDQKVSVIIKGHVLKWADHCMGPPQWLLGEHNCSHSLSALF